VRRTLRHGWYPHGKHLEEEEEEEEERRRRRRKMKRRMTRSNDLTCATAHPNGAHTNIESLAPMEYRSINYKNI